VKVQEIKEIAQRMGMTVRKATKTELVRSIQAQEGNSQCFDTGSARECGQQNCLWREDCK